MLEKRINRTYGKESKMYDGRCVRYSGVRYGKIDSKNKDRVMNSKVLLIINMLAMILMSLSGCEPSRP